MSTKSTVLSVLCVLGLFGMTSSNAFADETVQSWIGVIEDQNGSHDPSHDGDHMLKFTRSSDGESFYISSGDEELLKEHLRNDKTISVKVDGRITSKFLFFGGNLVIDRFEKLADIAPIAHKRMARLRDGEGPMGRRNR